MVSVATGADAGAAVLEGTEAASGELEVLVLGVLVLLPVLLLPDPVPDGVAVLGVGVVVLPLVLMTAGVDLGQLLVAHAALMLKVAAVILSAPKAAVPLVTLISEVPASYAATKRVATRAAQLHAGDAVPAGTRLGWCAGT